MIEGEDLYKLTVDATIAFLGETLKSWDQLSSAQRIKWDEMADEINASERNNDDT